MNYLLKNNKLLKFDENIIIEKEYYANNIEVCVDESGFALFDKLNKDKAKVEDNLLKVGKTKIKTFEYNLPNFNYDFTEENEFEIDINIIKEASKFTDKKGLKPVLSGVYVNNLGTIIGTDSFKLYYYDKGKSDKSVILASEFVNEIVKYSNEKAKVRFNKSNVQVVFLNNKTIITGRLINAQYPNVEQILKANEQNCTTFDKETFLEIAEIGKLVNGNATVLFENNEVIFSGDNEYNQEFKCDFTFWCSLDYLLNGLSVFNENPTVFYNNHVFKFVVGNKTLIILGMRKK